MNRRQLLRLLALGVVGHTLDIDRLLWVPGQKTIFLPTITKSVSMADIMAAEYARILPTVRVLYERDNLFYRLLNKKPVVMRVSSRSMRIPLDLP